MSEQDIHTEASYLLELNPQQRAAVEYLEGPSLVIAGAGSGKTRVLTYKIMHLLAHGFEPWRIMALTFTNKAAREMKERIAQVAGERVASRLWMGTFHSIFLRILRVNAELIGFRKDFTIYDSADSKALVKSIIKDMDLDEKQYKPSTIAATISSAKNNLVSAAAYARDKDYREIDRNARRPQTAEIYRVYTERLRVAQAMDFDDILYFMNVLLRDNPDVLRHYQEYFRYILVDEYQDTNFAQHLIISQLSRGSGNICVVGDDAQSIYSFRGANIANILNLNHQYPGLQTFKLERNYRSTQNIINAAGSLIKKNRNQIPKNVYSENDKGQPIKVIRAYSDLEEASLVASGIAETRMSEHEAYDQFAILYRTNAQSRILEESLRKRAIPYRIYGGLSFYQRKEVKDAICYFRLTLNPDDDEALRRVINYPARGIGETTMKKLTTAAMEGNVSIWWVLTHPADYDLNINKGTAAKLQGFVELIQGFIHDNDEGANAFELAQLIYNRTGMLSSLMHDNTPEAISRQENLKELLVGLKEFVDSRLESGESEVGMADFLSEVSLATDQDTQAEDANEPKVTLMTVHAAKGLEFSNIYIVGVEEDLFPSAMASGSAEEIEEERRLLYVAITRAKNRCTISYTGSRFRNGQICPSRPSRFIRDIDDMYLHFVTSQGIDSAPMASPFDSEAVGGWNFGGNRYGGGSRYGGGGGRFKKPQHYSTGRSVEQPQDRLRTNSRRKVGATITNVPTVNDIDPATLKPGVAIIHNRYGRGVIVETGDMSGEHKIVVDFGSVGKKTLLTRMSKITIAED